MTEELQNALMELDAVVNGWANPQAVPGYTHHIALQPEALLLIALRCGALEGTALGDHRLQFTLGKSATPRAHKVYEVRDALGKLRSVLARLATVIDEIRSPELKALEFDTSPAAETRKYALRQNSVHGFETTFEFIHNDSATLLHVQSSNGAATPGMTGVGFLIETV
jgi:hypothetical protein